MYYVIYENAKLASFKSNEKIEAEKWLSRGPYKKGKVLDKKQFVLLLKKKTINKINKKK